MMRRVNSTFGRFAAAKQGVAAVEFALILPILVVLLLATFDGGRAVAAYMKMRAATYALASITNQYATIQSTDMASILGATSVVMAPYTGGTPAVKISQIKINNSGVSSMEWSAAQGTTARAVPSVDRAAVGNGRQQLLSDPGRGELYLHAVVWLFRLQQRHHLFR